MTDNMRVADSVSNDPEKVEWALREEIAELKKERDELIKQGDRQLLRLVEVTSERDFLRKIVDRLANALVGFGDQQ